jgi:hypothetical protein
VQDCQLIDPRPLPDSIVNDRAAIIDDDLEFVDDGR